MAKSQTAPCRRLLLVLGDQLDPDSALLRGADPVQDVVWMAEVRHEGEKVGVHVARLVVFLSGMRHLRDELRRRGFRVAYQELGDRDAEPTFAGGLRRAIAAWKPSRLAMLEAGEWSVAREFEAVARDAGLPLDVMEDAHFLCTHAEFERHASARRQLRMEFFYREMRVRHRTLLDASGQPEGGAWNFDEENRGSFGREGPGLLPAPRRFAPDAVTRAVMADVAAHFPSAPGSAARFDWPVTREEARLALSDFLENRLPEFGRYQDAMWAGQPWLYHSRLSAAMNLKLLDPREVIAAAERAWREKRAPLAATEGFIRQVLGWREYVRGIYWRFMPGYAERNALGATRPLPGFYWTGETEMACLRDCIRQTLELGYAHHIQRPMVTGLFGLLAGVNPTAMHAWYLGVYVDAVEWVELPNTLGMSQYADGGVMASKPYAASGRYLQRMGNYCAGCRFDPGQSTGERACPFTTLYWDFLARHEALLRKNPRMAMVMRNLDRLDAAERGRVRTRAEQIGETLLG